MLRTVAFLSQLQLRWVPLVSLGWIGNTIQNVWKDTGVREAILVHLDAGPALLYLSHHDIMIITTKSETNFKKLTNEKIKFIPNPF